MLKELKLYLKQKKRQFIVKKRVISFKKKILKLQKEKDEMKRNSSLNLPIPSSVSKKLSRKRGTKDE